MLFLLLSIIFLVGSAVAPKSSEVPQCITENEEWDDLLLDQPESPLVDCNMLDARFVECESVVMASLRNGSKVSLSITILI